ncbi:hypothetical protein [Planococcus rifietoensis]|uniref:hypothetical protein n=1 Tax=Planococcus TaxID=1372 RepID=UPI00201DF043|nr:hypothetical protein [Planococcus maritimus]
MEKSKLRIRNDEDGKTVYIDNENAQESIQYIQAHQIKSVDITYDYEEAQIDFLSECPTVEFLSLEGSSVKDISGIYYLKTLKALVINDTSRLLAVDFSRLTSLESIIGTLPPKAVEIGSLINLKKLLIWDYKPKGKNLKEIADLKALEDIDLTNSNITSLEGIQGLTKLRNLALFRMRALTNIEAIQHLSENLTSLQIEGAKNVQDFSSIRSVQSLEYLTLNNCGMIPSIRFIRQLPHLKGIQFWDSTIVDGDVSPCIELEYIHFTNKKHYSHRLIEGPRVNDRPTFIARFIPTNTESVSQNANLSEDSLPTEEWRIRIDDGDDQFTEENLVATETVLQGYKDRLSHLQEPSEKKIVQEVKEVVIRLNALNEEYDFFIETLEREELQEFIMEKAQQVGLETEKDITAEWREW